MRTAKAKRGYGMSSTKEFRPVRYAYGVAMALLLGGTAFSVATGQAGAQVAQNAPAAIVPRAGAPTSFADLAAQPRAGGGQHLDQAARAGAAPGRSVRGILPPLRWAGSAGPGPGPGPGPGWPGISADPRGRFARFGLHHFARRLHRHQQSPDPGRRTAPARSTASPSPWPTAANFRRGSSGAIPPRIWRC